MGRIRTGMAAVAIAGTLSACGRGGTLPGVVPGSDTTEPSVDASTDPSVREALPAALSQARHQRTGSFRAAMTMGEESARATGSYDLSSRSGQIEVYARVSGEAVTVEVITVRRGSWFRLHSSEWPCWVHEGAQASYPGVPVGTTGVPAAVLAALSVEVRRAGDGSVRADADLASVAGAVSSKLVDALGIPPSAADRVPVTVDVSPRGAVHWSAPISDVVEAASAADHVPGQDLPAGLSGTIEATLEPGALGGRIAPPGPHETVQLSADLEADMARCGAH